MPVATRSSPPAAPTTGRVAHATRHAEAQAGDPLWYRDAVIYEVHVRAFRDSSGDGVGDFRGLTEKLDYLCDLGVTALWLLPFYPSPLRDDGYDIADYTSVNPAYGTLRDFEVLIREAHKRGLRVITELVCNHTSDQHPWFQRARRARPGSVWRDFYVWSDTPDRYSEARVIFKDFEASNWTWDPIAGAYFWHRFYSHQPDLNFDNPRVRAAIVKVLDFWLDRGVDGVRLDAVPYLYERDGTDCENLPETHAFLRDLRRHVDERYGDRMLLAEANQWPEEAAAYFGNGDECQMAFHFPVMPRLFMAIRMEDRLPIVDIIEQTPPIPETAQWALFLRNHDELTLEMVTDEERDYMYRTYAADPQARINLGIRRRLAPLLGNHRRRIELMNGLLFSLPGTPVIYYGDEIGMGDNVHLGDRDSVRTPMQWNSDANGGFSSAGRERLYLPVVTDPEHHFEAVNVALQQSNPHSLLWWMKRLIALRKRHPAFARGDLRLIHPENSQVLAFVRGLGEERILVVANLSRFFQPVDLDLADYAGQQPVEMFGRVAFPTIGRTPYPLTLGPHEFMWLSLGQPAAGLEAASAIPAELPVLATAKARDLLSPTVDASLTPILLEWAARQSWFRGGAPRETGGEIVDRGELGFGGAAVLIVLRVDHSEGDPETYALPLTTAARVFDSLVFEDGLPARSEAPEMRIAALVEDGSTARRRSTDGPVADGPSVRQNADGHVARFLVDASSDLGLVDQVVGAVAARHRSRTLHGEVSGRPGESLSPAAGRRVADAVAMMRAGETMGADEIGTADPLPDEVTLEWRYALDSESDPGYEAIRFLSSRGPAWLPQVLGELQYAPRTGPRAAVAVLRAAAADDGDMAVLTRHSLLGFLEQVVAAGDAAPQVRLTAADLVRAAGSEPPAEIRDLAGSFLETVRELGARLAELHLALGSDAADPAFAPEPFTRHYQRSLHQSTDALARRALRLLARRSRIASAEQAGETALVDATAVLGLETELDERLRRLLPNNLRGSRIRLHGFMDLDRIRLGERGLPVFEVGPDPTRPAGIRRIKRSPLRHLAILVGAFHDVALGRLRESDLGGSLRREDAPAIDAWARAWFLWVSGALLRGYRVVAMAVPAEAAPASAGSLVPTEDQEWSALLDVFLLQDAFEALLAALAQGPGLPGPALRGLLELLGG